MSLLPYLLERRRTLEPFGLGYEEDELLNALAPLMSGDKAWRSALRDFGSIKEDRSKFQINLDVHHFAPDEISVKTADGFVVVEGRHEEKRDVHGWVSRQFIRRYQLPEGCSEVGVQSRLSSDGVLTVVAPLEAAANERVVPIVHTGPVQAEPGEALLT